MTTYTTITQEQNSDLDLLSQNNFQLQVAKSVSSPNGPATYNVVYQSKFLANNMDVAWTTVYGLNWTTNVPASGAQVVYSGEWQQCSLGSSYDLNQEGEWVPNQNDPNADPKSLNVGSNGYQTAVNVIVGVQDPTTLEWTPIWVGADALLEKTHGEYTPLQSVQIWFQEGTQTSTMISNQGTPTQTFDMTPTPLYYFSYDATSGAWRTPQPTPFISLKKEVDANGRKGNY